MLEAVPTHGPAPGRRARIALCYGTRPQVIKTSALGPALRRAGELLTIDTGQHYDHELNALLYAQLGVPRPDVCLEVGSDEPAEQVAAILTRASGILRDYCPAAVVVIGDTNSTLGCALAAAKLRIPVVHVEAGLRAADALMSEETNRRLVDALSALLCAPSASAVKVLERERHDARVVPTGDVARDVLMHNTSRLERVARPDAWPLSAREPFVFVTLHRAELVGRSDLLQPILRELRCCHVPVVFPVHPRTRAVLDESVLEGDAPRLHLLPPIGYLETLAAIRAARLVVTDSGGVQREAYWLGTPCITLRDETEWVETVELGANTLLPPAEAPGRLIALVRRIEAERGRWNRNAYGNGDAADRVGEAVRELIEAGDRRRTR